MTVLRFINVLYVVEYFEYSHILLYVKYIILSFLKIIILLNVL